MKKNNKGFTLAEMLIVVAIIGVLVSILTPSFATQLERARETADAANIRTAISECISDALTNGVGDEEEIMLMQQTAGWTYVKQIADYNTSSVATVFSTTSAPIPGVTKSITVKVSATGAVSFEGSN